MIMYTKKKKQQQKKKNNQHQTKTQESDKHVRMNDKNMRRTISKNKDMLLGE